MFNEEILSYRISERPDDYPYRHTFHSDQKWAYQMKPYKKRLKKKNIFQSMSRKGNCLDNSPMEKFLWTVKTSNVLWGHLY
ncbi:DDE-type integrase/transposase/recombinase [Listeria monocytogenes]|nr:DDE-type integrase/transposase/recombinase [Listeria monocytogenes]